MIGLFGRLVAAVTLGQDCPQMTQRRWSRLPFDIGGVSQCGCDLFNALSQDKYRTSTGLDPAGTDAEEARRLHEDPGREDEGCPGRLLR